MITCTRRIQFCAGHRVFGHEGKCKNVHGHNYVAFIKAVAPTGTLDGLGRVIDFSVLKERVGGWIDAQWDHTFIAFVKDQDVIESVRAINEKPIFILPTNPTAENMAEYLLKMVCPMILEGTGITVNEITIWETENCFATAKLHGH